jgi:tetratricopeptide (TPR) repeat protein
VKKLVRGLAALIGGVAVAGAFAAAGVWPGGLAGAVLIGVGIYIAPEFSGFLTRRRDRATAAQEGLDRVSVSAVVPVRLGEVGPAALLRADRQVVGFIDRPELEGLREWCDGEKSRVLLLTGAGGVGKTRLALQLAQQRQALGWMCRIIRPGEEADAVTAVRAVSSGPALLIVDYAETRLGLVGMLRGVAGDNGGRLRVLMLARGRGEWWGQLEASTDVSVRSLAASAVEMVLTASPVTVAAGDLVEAAIDAFADAVGAPVPERVELVLPAGAVPILVLHAAALLAVLNFKDHQQAGAARVVADDQVLDDLLAREKAFWLGAARTVHLAGPDGIDSVLAAQAVTVACLFAAADEAEAAQMLQRVPGLADSKASARRKIARWLRQLYPPPGTSGLPATTPGWWGSLQPDLAAERLVVGQLAAAPDLAGACLRGLGRDQARRALTLLARACSHGSEAPGLLAAALRADLAGLGVPAVEVAVQTGGLLGKVLAAVLGDATASLEQLITIQHAIPHPTLTLAAADAAVTERIVGSLPDDIPSAERAHWADALSTRLAQAGKQDQALEPAQQAVTIYRELAAADPGRYCPDLAAAVANLGVRLHQLGRPADAVAAAEEAVTIRRELAQADPDRYLPDLATTLSNLSGAIAELGKPTEALAAAQEGADIHRQLAQANPGRYLPELAASLVNLAAMFSKLGRGAEARSCGQESAAIYWRLAGTYPDRFLPEVAISFTNLGALLADLGYVADALLPSGHAVAVYRQLAAISPDRYQPELASSLANLGTLLSELGRPDEALAQSNEAVAILRDLAERIPGRHRRDLASALSNLGISLAGLGRHTDALAATEEAVTIYRDLADTSPDRYRPELATSVANLGIRLADLNRHADAFKATKEAVTIYRELAAAQPRRYRPDLAASLDDLGLRLSALGKATAALPVSQEAVRIHRDLAETNLARYQPRLANSLTYMGAILAQLGRTTAALTATEEALHIYRDLAATGSDRFRAERAGALANLARALSALGRPAEALPHAEEAVHIYREAARANPGRFDIYLAGSLDSLATTLTSLDRTADAATAREEAATLREQAPHL